jgi:lysophospholipase L1-like esterase
MKTYSFFTFIILILLLTMITIIYKVNISLANPHVLRSVALGDSITYGTGDPAKKGYIVRFKEQFEQYMDTPVHVTNFAKPKLQTNHLLNQLKDKKVKKTIQQSNYIILYIGTNDFRKSAEYKFDQINLNKINQGKNIYSQNLYHILTEIRKNHYSAPIIVMGLYNPYTEYKNHKQLHVLINKWNNEINNVIAHFDNIWFVPTLDLFHGTPKENYFSDSIHPNAAGYQLITNRLLEKIILLEKGISRE